MAINRKTKPATEPKIVSLYDNVSPSQRADEEFAKSVKVKDGANNCVEAFLQVVERVRANTPSNGSFSIADFLHHSACERDRLSVQELFRLWGQWIFIQMKFKRVAEIPSIANIVGGNSTYVWL